MLFLKKTKIPKNLDREKCKASGKFAPPPTKSQRVLVLIPTVSNLRSNLTSEAIEAVWRLPWPQRLPKKAVRGNMHINTMVIEAPDNKSLVTFEL